MYKVVKRDGKIKDFDISKIVNAIKGAFEAKNKQYESTTLDFLALKVTAHFQEKISSGLISVEDIQDSVETVLIQAGYDDVAKAYILYRRQHENARNAKNSLLDYKSLVNNYLKINDWRATYNIHFDQQNYPE